MISPGQLFGPGAKIRHDHLSDLAVHRSVAAAAGHPRWAGLETMLRREALPIIYFGRVLQWCWFIFEYF